ncbi:MAG: hypothetical protein PHW00_04120 [Clostridia bacterium]|nr:hypothetical protein [Clostridia bacterium]
MQSNVGVNNYSCTAVENDWLDITYTQRNYIQEEQQLSNFKRKRRPLEFIKTNAKYIVAIMLLVVAVAGMLIVGVEGDGVFTTAKLAYTSTIFDSLIEGKTSKTKTNTVVMPVNMQIESISDDGIVTLNGGKIATCLVAGTVASTTEHTVTVKTGDNTVMIYANVSEVLVQTGDTVAQYGVLGRYEQSMTVQIVYNNQPVNQVIGSLYSFEWQS